MLLPRRAPMLRALNPQRLCTSGSYQRRQFELMADLPGERPARLSKMESTHGRHLWDDIASPDECNSAVKVLEPPAPPAMSRSAVALHLPWLCPEVALLQATQQAMSLCCDTDGNAAIATRRRMRCRRHVHLKILFSVTTE